MKLMSLIPVICIILMISFFSGCTSNNSQNGTNGSSWVTTYTPVHSLGTETDNFWTVYPEINPKSGESVAHLDWVLDSLDKGCVLFVVHRTGCVGCQAQADRVIAFAEQYQGQVEFFDLDIATGGSVEQQAYDAYVYDPNGEPGYIALTGIITLQKTNGNLVYGWHSWEGNVADSDMEDWVKDAIYYYHVNKQG